MDFFEKLENNPYFLIKRAYENHVYYDFFSEDDQFRKYAGVRIPRKAGEEILWYYREFEKATDKNKIHLTKMNSEINSLKQLNDNWFYELVREANTSLEKRDKIRRLFK